MHELICPKCGKNADTLYNNVCEECFFKIFTLAQIAPVMHITVCSKCNAILERGRWIDGKQVEDTAIEKAESELFIHEMAQNIELDVEPRKVSPYIYRIKFYISADIDGLPVEDEVETEVRIERNACDICSRISAGYFEGILQLRAAGRKVTDEEKKKCESIIYSNLNRLQKKGDKLAFLSNSLDLKEGSDFYIGSTHATRNICKAIISEMGGSFTESPTLFGMKDGKNIYRVTFSLRLPQYKKGDVIDLNGRNIQIKISEKMVKGIDLTTGDRVLMKHDEISDAKYLGNEKDAVKAVLVALENDTAMILDPKTYQTITIKKPYFLSDQEGIEIPILKTEVGIIPLP
ncbi:60S ribosomal export protein NMD3 [Methanohalophilus sp.]|uniref:60S ribosomal export protein NMD3 n=1 Tax=Methanohalophilus sp. TaxID=1966352 RepID=UPI00260D43B3|nr:60S ribosomal export protein NMD3 [Methanohalophilus sp.]MDK2892849.1 ribosomal export protein [Methanohalophilus sp.]